MSRELMQQALEALIWTTGSDDFGDGGKAREGALKLLFPAIDALRQALETEQKPVAWRYKYPDGFWRFSNGERVNGSDSIKSQALYTAPPRAAEWVGLTDEEIEHIADSEWEEAFVRMIEAKLQEKNHG